LPARNPGEAPAQHKHTSRTGVTKNARIEPRLSTTSRIPEMPGWGAGLFRAGQRRRRSSRVGCRL